MELLSALSRELAEEKRFVYSCKTFVYFPARRAPMDMLYSYEKRLFEGLREGGKRGICISRIFFIIMVGHFLINSLVFFSQSIL